MPDKVKEAIHKRFEIRRWKFTNFAPAVNPPLSCVLKSLQERGRKRVFENCMKKKKRRKAQNVETKRTQMEEWFRPCVRRKHYYIYFTHHVFIITQKPWQQQRAYERYASLRNGRTSCMVAFFLSFWIAAENSCLKDFLKKKKEGGQQKIWTLN